MKTLTRCTLFFVLLIVLSPDVLTQEQALYKSIRDFGVLPENSASVNRENLQKAIDWASPRGAALYVDPSPIPYTVDGGLILKENVSLIGVHGPVGRSTNDPEKKHPVGSVFQIEDENNPFITVESSTQIKGIQFWYPNQAFDNASKIIKYPSTIQMSQNKSVEGVTLSCLTFYGEYTTMDFTGSRQRPCEQILFEHCYGYPLSGEFIKISYCYDIPRILHCHINPANMVHLGRSFRPEVIDAVVANRTYAYTINNTDNAQVIDVFTFGTYGGIYLGEETYGQMTNFNFDCVTVGIYKSGNNSKNRNWQIAQGSIIANTGANQDSVHSIIIEGKGHTSLSNVEAFSGSNPALTTYKTSKDFMLIKGKEKLTVSLSGCRMQGYLSDEPLIIQNPNAVIQAAVCVDKYEKPFSR